MPGEEDSSRTLNIAGLSFEERLRKTASRAGFDRVLFFPESQGKGKETAFAEQRGAGKETCLVLMESGYLPDSEYLKSLKTCCRDPDKWFSPESSSVLVCKTGEPEKWMAQLAINKSQAPSVADLKKQVCPQEITVGEGRLYEVKNPDQVSRVEKQLFDSLVKDTEGFMSKHVERKISLAISRWLVNTNITPNQMTVFSIGIGLLGAWCMGIRQGGWQIAGALMFLAHSILDGCDGELARIKFLQSRFGGLLDYWGDNVVHSAVFLAIAVEWSRRSGEVYPYYLASIAILGALASAGWVYWNTMREKEEEEPLYTSVSQSNEPGRAAKVADFLSRRDFIYLVVLLAVFRHLDWFLILSAIGAPCFFLVLVWIGLRERSAMS